MKASVGEEKLIAEPTICRKFSLADALLLIAGLAIVLSIGAHLLKFATEYFLQICRIIFWARPDVRDNWPVFWKALREPVIQLVSYSFQFAGTLIVGMTPIFFIVRLRRPRPPWRTLLLQPGFAAALAMVFGLFWVTGLIHILLPDRLNSFTGPGIVIGGTVAAIWIILALCRRWNAEPSWVDRLGRAMGAIAIATAFLGLIMYRL